MVFELKRHSKPEVWLAHLEPARTASTKHAISTGVCLGQQSVVKKPFPEARELDRWARTTGAHALNSFLDKDIRPTWAVPAAKDDSRQRVQG